MSYGGKSNPSPYVISGNNRNPNTSIAYDNKAFNRAETSKTSRNKVQQSSAKAQPSSNRNVTIGIVVGVVVTLVVLGVVGAIIGTVLSNQSGDDGTINQQPTQTPQPRTTQLPQPQPTEIQQPRPTQLPQPQSTEIPQPQTDAPRITEAAQNVEGDIFDTGICGTRPVLANRILGGTNAQIGHWPWIGSLKAGLDHFCGTSLLNNRWAVTASHCFDGEDPDNIVFGSTTVDYPDDDAQSTGFIAFHHPLYHDTNAGSEYDITLLKLNQNIAFNDNVRPICLATLVEETAMYSNCRAAGWGALSDPDLGSAGYPEILQQVDLPLISSADCQEIDSEATDNIICGAGTPQGGLDTCQGDSGGPLVCTNNQDESLHLVGIVSTGNGCGHANTPGFYTRVTRYINWIQTTVNQNS